MSDPVRSEVGQPEWRAALLAEAIRRTAFVAGPINPFPLMTALRACLGLTEEECGEEILLVLAVMVRSGLYASNTYDPTTDTFHLGGETRLTAAPVLTAFLHGETVQAED